MKKLITITLFVTSFGYSQTMLTLKDKIDYLETCQKVWNLSNDTQKEKIENIIRDKFSKFDEDKLLKHKTKLLLFVKEIKSWESGQF